MDEIARDARAQILSAEEELKQAEKIRTSYPQNGGTTPEYLAKAARAEADYRMAWAKWDDLRKILPDQTEWQAENVRRELESAIDDVFAAKPEDIDTATMTLLESGILRPAEYERLLTSALDAGNYTMTRLIGAAAQKASGDAAEKYGQSSELTKAFRAVELLAQRIGGEVYRNNFGVLQDTLHRCLRNSALWPQ